MSTPEPISDAGLEQLLAQYRNAVDDGTINDVAPPGPRSAARWLATLEQQTRRVAAVRALHESVAGTCTVCVQEIGWDPACLVTVPYPCPTVRALDA